MSKLPYDTTLICGQVLYLWPKHPIVCTRSQTKNARTSCSSVCVYDLDRPMTCSSSTHELLYFATREDMTTDGAQLYQHSMVPLRSPLQHRHAPEAPR